MTLESLLLTGLFSLAAVAFIGVLNARGVWRTALAAVLALGCLVAALWHTQSVRARHAATALGVTESGAAYAGGVFPTSGRAAASAAGTDAGVQAGAGEGRDGGLVSSAEGPGDLAALAARAQTLRDSLAAEDPSRARALSDSAYQIFERRAEEYVSRARDLRERAARVSVALAAAAGSDAAASGGFQKGEEAAEALNEALQSLAAAALDLRAYFRATGRDEEQRLSAAFRRDLEAAAEPLRRAVAGAGAL